MKPFPWFAIPILGLIFWTGQQVYSHYDQPPLWLVLTAIFSLALLPLRIPTMGWLWWGAGLLTLLWSQTPGNTLVLSLWELVYLAAFAAGAFVPGMIGLGLVLAGYGLFTNLSLDAVGAAQFFSGSSHYIYGAQALLLIPVMALYMFRSKQWQLSSGIALSSILFLALLSGARAVYLPLGLMLVLLVWRLWREGIRPLRILLGLGTVALVIFAIDTALPFHPVQTALLGKTSLSKQVEDTSAEGSFGSRLQMWSQTLHIALKNPLGTGNGSFRDVIAHYQQYATVNFSNAHNYYLETAATGGWLRLALLLGMLGWILWRGWKSTAWPWALGAAGLWATVAFDITGMYPSVMMLAFASLGAVYGQLKPSPAYAPKPAYASMAGLALAAGLTVWWYWPCGGGCATGRHLGYRPEVLTLAAKLPEQERTVLLDKTAQFNPNSLWVYRTRLQYAQDPQDQLQILRLINQKFPLASPQYYLQQARLEAQINLKAEAIQTLKTGLQRFPPDLKPAGVPFGDSVYLAYERWGLEAPALLQKLQTQ